jgi:cyclase
MENVRIIPRLDIKGPNVVKGVFTEGLRIVGNPKKLAYKYYQEGADELLCMDIVASLYQRNFDFNLLKSISEGIFIPITVGGGIRSLQDINNALNAGADKVAINTFAIKEPAFLKKAAKKFGSQCIALSVEAKRRADGTWEAYTDGGREHTGIDAVKWIKKALKFNIGEIILTSVDKDGTRSGYDIELTKQVTSFASVPVIAHGGAGGPESIEKILIEGNPEAVSISSILHYKETSVDQIKKALYRKGINVRMI